MTTITTPSNLDIVIDRGTIFKTAKGRYIIADLIHDEKGNLQDVYFCPIADVQQVGIGELRQLVTDGRVKL